MVNKMTWIYFLRFACLSLFKINSMFKSGGSEESTAGSVSADGVGCGGKGNGDCGGKGNGDCGGKGNGDCGGIGCGGKGNGDCGGIGCGISCACKGDGAADNERCSISSLPSVDFSRWSCARTK